MGMERFVLALQPDARCREALDLMRSTMGYLKEQLLFR